MSAEQLAILERCWAISEEGEDLKEFAGSHLEDCWAVVVALARSPDPLVRWQAIDAAAGAPGKAGTLLRKALGDVDSYVKRKAISGLARLRPDDAKELLVPLLVDPDPYIRLAAIDLASVSEDLRFVRETLETLARDKAEFVRNAALNRLARF